MGPTLTLIFPEMTSPSTPSMVAPGMQGATLSTSSSTSQACSGGTGTTNECSSSISSDSRRCRQCSAGQPPRKVTAVVGRTMQVRGRLCFRVGMLSGRPQGGLARLGSGRRPLRGPGPDRDGAHVGEPDPRLGDRPIRAPDQRGHAHGGPGLRRPVELLVSITPSWSELRHPDPGQNLVRTQRRGQVVDEEILGGDLTLAAWAAGYQGDLQCDRYRGEITLI